MAGRKSGGVSGNASRRKAPGESPKELSGAGAAGASSPEEGPNLAPPGSGGQADVEVTDTSDRPGGAVVTRFLQRERDARLKRYEPLLPGSYRRGGGPGTSEGRAVASRNALAHGAYSDVPHGLPAYVDHQRQVQLALKPVGALEDSIAEEVAHATWRRDLLARHEKREASILESLDPPASEVARHSGFPFGEAHHHLLEADVDTGRLRRELRSLWRSHLYVAASGGLGLAREGLAVFGARAPHPMREEEFFRRWDEAVSLAPFGTQARAGLHAALHAALQAEAGQAFLARLWVYRNWVRVGAARALLRSRAVTEFLGSTTLGRARSLIDRSVREGMESMERAQLASQKKRWAG